jgi:hypothetical protein
MDYQTAVGLREAGVSQSTRKHINKYGTVFWTRRQTDYPACPTPQDILTIGRQRLREIYPERSEQVLEVDIILMISTAYGLDRTDQLARVLLERLRAAG